MLKRLFADWISAWQNKDQNSDFLSRKQWQILLIAEFILLLWIVYIFDIPYRDAASRYAPMADALVSGNFKYAFHPRIPPLFPVLGGIVSLLTGLDGFAAVKLVSLAAFFGSFFLTQALMKRVFGKFVASFSGIIYLCCPDLIRLSFSGERDSLKSLLIVAITYALIRICQERDKFSGYLLCGIFCGLSVLTRIEMLFFSAVAMTMVILFECRRSFLPWRSLIAFVTALIISSPGMLINFYFTGVALPDNYTAKMAHMIMGQHIAWYEPPIVFLVIVILLWVAGLLLRSVNDVWRRYLTAIVLFILFAGFIIFCCKIEMNFKHGTWPYFQRLVKGLFSLYYSFLAIGLLWRIVNKKWLLEETLIMILFVMHGFGVVALIAANGQLRISPRYLVSALPLIFGWCGVSLAAVECLLPLLPGKCKKIWHVIVGIAFFCCTLHGVFPAFEAYIPCKDALRRQVMLNFTADINKMESKRHISARHKPGIFNKHDYVFSYPVTIRVMSWKEGRYGNGSGRITAISYMAKVRPVTNKGDYVIAIKPRGEKVPKMKFGKKLIRKMFDRDYDYELWSNVK